MLRLELLEKDQEVRCSGDQSQTLEILEKPVEWANGVIVVAVQSLPRHFWDPGWLWAPRAFFSLSLSASSSFLKVETAAARLACSVHSSQVSLKLQHSRKPEKCAFPHQHRPAVALLCCRWPCWYLAQREENLNEVFWVRCYPTQMAVALAENAGQCSATPEGN